MTEKVSIEYREELPMPLLYLATPEMLAEWYAGQLRDALEKGRREMTISCFDSAAMGYPLPRAAAAVLRAVTDFLYDHPEAERLTILCAGEACYQAYRFQWNMWYAERKPDGPGL